MKKNFCKPSCGSNFDRTVGSIGFCGFILPTFQGQNLQMLHLWV